MFSKREKLLPSCPVAPSCSIHDSYLLLNYLLLKAFKSSSYFTKFHIFNNFPLKVLLWCRGPQVGREAIRATPLPLAVSSAACSHAAGPTTSPRPRSMMSSICTGCQEVYKTGREREAEEDGGCEVRQQLSLGSEWCSNPQE